MKELETVAQTEEERIRYETRRKAILDERSRADWYEHGLERAEEMGSLRGQIQLIQRLLGLPVDSKDNLRRLSLDDLTAMSENLANQLSQRQDKG